MHSSWTYQKDQQQWADIATWEMVIRQVFITE